MEDDNIFDEDDALDYIMFEEHSKEENQKDNKSSGCLTLLLICTIPAMSSAYFISRVMA